MLYKKGFVYGNLLFGDSKYEVVLGGFIRFKIVFIFICLLFCFKYLWMKEVFFMFYEN